MDLFEPDKRCRAELTKRALRIATVILAGIGVALPAFSAQDVFIQNGMASFYADRFEGRPTASGETFRQQKLTGAHLTLPFGTHVQVTNRANGRQAIVRINDRGPYAEDRIIDVSRIAAERLGFFSEGVAEVRLEVVAAAAAVKIESATPPDSTEEVLEFYRIQASRRTPRGFGVQIGSFRELTNLLQVADGLSADHRRVVTVQVFHIQRVKVYRIIVGEFARRNAAEALRSELQAQYPDCFIYRF